MTKYSSWEGVSKVARWAAIAAVVSLASCGDVNSDLITSAGADRRICDSNAQCSIEKPVCEVDSGRCGGCTGDDACGVGRPPRCNISTGSCVEGMTNRDCSGGRR